MKLDRKKFILIMAVIVLAIGTSLILLNLNNTKYVSNIKSYTGNIKFVGGYESEGDLLVKASYILEGKITKKEVPFKYHSVMFEIIHFQVSDVLYSENKIDNEVLILRESEMFAPLEENEEYILYLYDYVGPIASNVKMVCGGNVGALIITNESKDKTGSKLRSLKKYKEHVKNYVRENR